MTTHASPATGLLVYAVFFMIGALIAALATRQVRKVEDRVAGGEDRYFEEHRAYRAYPRLRDPRHVRRSGYLLMFGALLLGSLHMCAP